LYYIPKSRRDEAVIGNSHDDNDRTVSHPYTTANMVCAYKEINAHATTAPLQIDWSIGKQQQLC